MSNVLTTYDYSIFKKRKRNRPLKTSILNKLIDSMSQENLLSKHPIIVNSDLEVIDGQHRLEIAKKLLLEVSYVIDHAINDRQMILLQNAGVWESSDFINYHAECGSEAHQDFKKVMDLVGSYNLARFFLKRGKFSSIAKCIKSGELKCMPFEEVKKIWENVLLIKEKAIDIANPIQLKIINQRNFSIALIFFLKIDGVDINHFLSKLPYGIKKIRPTTTYRETVEIFIDIYNTHARKSLIASL